MDMLAQAGGDTLLFLNVQYIFYLIYTFATGVELAPEAFFALFADIVFYAQIISIILSLLIMAGIVYVYIRTQQVARDEEEKIYGASASSIGEGIAYEPGQPRNPRWQRVQSLIESENDGDWRRAILEADILLDEMLVAMGYQGEGVGERLKQVERSDFRTLNKAWEAHKARNAIAHEGESFQLTQREARRIIGLFEEVFQEFFYI